MFFSLFILQVLNECTKQQPKKKKNNKKKETKGKTDSE